jgi:hypothetical protein
MTIKSACKLLVIIIFILFYSISISFAEEKKYPPYPDVWGYELPWPKKDSMRSNIEISKMQNGDYLVTYIKKIIDTKRSDGSCCNSFFEFEGISFFSGIKKRFTVEEFNEFWRNNHENKVKKDSIVFKDGSSIERINTGAGRSPDPFYSYYIVKKDKDGKVIYDKILLYLLEKPKKVKIDKNAERNWDYKNNYYLNKVENIYPIFIPLDDDSFLLYNGGGNFIIRYDKNFNTKTSLQNNKIFFVDRKDILNKLADKSNNNDQLTNDIIAKYLLNLKKEGEK